MILFPNCKINLGLNITARRDDGFHDLETLFYPLPFYDILEIIEAPALPRQAGGDSFKLTGLPINSYSGENLCEKALQMMRKDFPGIPPVYMHLHKAIPPGAGLGGGSADGSFTLQLINKKFGLGLPVDRLMNYAGRIGSDCPFFILNKPCFATGRGEILEPISFSLKGYTILLVNPGLHISTAEAFSRITPSRPAKSIREIITKPVETWRGELRNDFEPSLFEKYPLLASIRERLYERGAIYASLTGTGSSIYGIFRGPLNVDAENFSSQFPTVNSSVVSMEAIY